MSLLNTFEDGAQRLGRCLQSPLPEHHLLCAVRFFGQFWLDENLWARRHLAEPYIRQYAPRLAAAARMCNPIEFLPNEIEDLKRLARLIKEFSPGVVSLDHVSEIERVLAAATAGEYHPQPLTGDGVVVAGLLVEHAPNFDLPARGRLLWVRVTAEERRRKFIEDDVVLSSVLTRPNNDTQEQAHIAWRQARRLLSRHYGLKPDRHFHVTYAVESATVALEGPSLGVAFAIGAIAAIAQEQTFRDRLEISGDVAFTGELAADGQVRPVDGQGLRLKIERALHNRLRHLVVPESQMAEAWHCVNELEQSYPDHRLKLVSADDLSSVFEDRNLVQRQRRTRTQYLTRRARKSVQEPLVGLPVLAVLATMLAILVLPAKYLPWFDHEPAHIRFNLQTSALEVLNADSIMLWSRQLPCTPISDGPNALQLTDLNRDSSREILFSVPSIGGCPSDAQMYCLSSRGNLLWSCYCAIPSQYPGDTVGTLYGSPAIHLASWKGKTLIVTEIGQSTPARSHIRIWGPEGDSLGWYINAGGTQFHFARDLDADGRPELVFTGYNYRRKGTALFALKLDSLYGCSPPYEDPNFDLGYVRRGSQWRYVLIPWEDMARLEHESGVSQPSALIENRNEVFDLHVGVSSKSPNARIIYSFDKDLRIADVKFTDQYLKRHQELGSSGDLPPFDSAYTSRLQDSVQYWSSSGWVSEATRRGAKDSAPDAK